jgi:hypothetical protein
MSELFHAFAYDWRVSVAMSLCGLAFFGVLTMVSFARQDRRARLPGLLLIDVGILSSLVRNLFFFDLSPHPTQPGGVWRLLSALVIGWGFVLFLRTWMQGRQRLPPS